MNFFNNNSQQAPPSGAPGMPGSYNPYGPQSVSISSQNEPINLGPPVLPKNSTQLP
jgi:hypothetical protein